MRRLVARLGDGRAQILDAREDGRELDEARVRSTREQARERRLARAGAAPEDERGQLPPAFDQAAQDAPLADQVLLPDELFERARPHALGERGERVGRGRVLLRLGEQTLVLASRHKWKSSVTRIPRPRKRVPPARPEPLKCAGDLHDAPDTYS